MAKGKIPWNRTYFTLEEAKERKIDYKYWMDPSIEPGEYVQTDDEYVVVVNRKKKWVNRVGQESTYVQTSKGAYCIEYSKEFKIRHTMHNVQAIGTSDPNRVKILPQCDIDFVDYLFNGFSVKDAIRLAYKDKRVVISKILNKKSVIKYMASKYEKEMESAGLTRDWYFQRLKAESENVKDSKLSDRFVVLERIAQLLDVIPQKTIEERDASGMYIDEETIKMVEAHERKELTP